MTESYHIRELCLALLVRRGDSGSEASKHEACVLRNPFVHSIAAHEVGHGLSGVYQDFPKSLEQTTEVPMPLNPKIPSQTSFS